MVRIPSSWMDSLGPTRVWVFFVTTNFSWLAPNWLCQSTKLQLAWYLSNDSSWCYDFTADVPPNLEYLLTKVPAMMARWRTLMLKGWYRWPKRLLRNWRKTVEGIISLSTSALSSTSVSGIPNMAYIMQNTLPPFESGVTWPYPETKSKLLSNEAVSLAMPSYTEQSCCWTYRLWLRRCSRKIMTVQNSSSALRTHFEQQTPLDCWLWPLLRSALQVRYLEQEKVPSN